MVYLVHDNQIYGLTKGQTSPTSDLGTRTRTTPFGTVEPGLNPLAISVMMDAGFVARGFSGNPKHLAELIKQAVRHPGFALVEVLQNCVSFNHVNTAKWYSHRVYDVAEDKHDPTDPEQAWKRALEWGDRIPIGVIYKSSRPSYDRLHPVASKGPIVGDPGRLLERLVELPLAAGLAPTICPISGRVPQRLAFTVW